MAPVFQFFRQFFPLSPAALVNFQSVEAVESELKRRAVMGN
jgi:hypothetical protein